jgi:hypothetical protein
MVGRALDRFQATGGTANVYCSSYFTYRGDDWCFSPCFDSSFFNFNAIASVVLGESGSDSAGCGSFVYRSRRHFTHAM